MKHAVATLVLAGTAAFLAAVPAHAKDKPEITAPPAIYQAVVDCRTIGDTAQRLACFDRTVGEMAAATTQKDLVILDRESMRETRKGLFGFTLPKLKLFGGNDDEQADSISAVIARVGTNAKGRYLLVMENAGRWEQIDNENIRTPRRGDTVVIKKAALGSYLAKIGNDRAFRIRRLNE